MDGWNKCGCEAAMTGKKFRYSERSA
jgi:hypothetical protein